MAVRKAASVPMWLPTLVLRAGCIFLGTTWVAHRLARRLDQGRGGAGYVAALGDALWPDDALIEAAGRTLVLGAGALIVALVAGGALAALLRRPGRIAGGVSAVLGPLTGPLLALTVPGLALYPIARLAGGDGLVLTGELGAGGVDRGLAFYTSWFAMAGVALIPTAAVLLARDGGPTGAFGLDVARAPLASRPEPQRRWLAGFPTMLLLLMLASVEVVTGVEGLFLTLFRATSEGDADGAMAVVVPVAVVGAALALAIDLLGRRTSPAGSELAAEPLGRGRTAAPLALPALVVVGLAVLGSGLDAAAIGDPDAILADPRVGGPWLGTDELGRSLAVRTAVALGPALLAAVIPAVAATVVGAPAAWIRRSLAERAGQIVDAMIDLLWWPAPILVTLAAWSERLGGAGSELPLLRPIVLAVTGALLIPPATRLLGRNVSYRTSHQWAVRLHTVLFLSAMALAVHLLVGLAGPQGSAAHPTLGSMVAEGVPSYGDSPWPTLVPLGAAVIVALTLYWLSSAVARPARVPTAPITRPRPGELPSIGAGAGDLVSTGLRFERPGDEAEVVEADMDEVEPVWDREGVEAAVEDEAGRAVDEGAVDAPASATLLDVEIEGAEVVEADRDQREATDPFFEPDAEQLRAEEQLAAELAVAGRIDLTDQLALDVDHGMILPGETPPAEQTAVAEETVAPEPAQPVPTHDPVEAVEPSAATPALTTRWV